MTTAPSHSWDPIFTDSFPGQVGTLERRLADGTPDDTYRFTLTPAHAGPDGLASRGLLAAVMEAMLSATVLQTTVGSLSPAAGHGATTVSLNTDYVGVARPGDTLFGEASVTRRTRTIAFVSGRLFMAEPDGSQRDVVSALGVWKLLTPA
jgi:acyl-coenzyme A thioesterase PaaI-like protein